MNKDIKAELYVDPDTGLVMSKRMYEALQGWKVGKNMVFYHPLRAGLNTFRKILLGKKKK